MMLKRVLNGDDVDELVERHRHLSHHAAVVLQQGLGDEGLDLAVHRLRQVLLKNTT